MLPLVDEDWQQLAQARIASRRDSRGAAVRDQPGAGGAEGRPRARLRALSLPGREGALAGRRGLSPGGVDARRRRSASRICGWSAAPTSPGRRWRTATSTAPTGSRRGTSASSGPDYADAEWVAGFIALTRLDDPKRAIGHFTRFQAAVATPISLGRAGYWLGLAHEKAGDAAAAARRLRHGARRIRRASTASSPPRSWRAPPDPRLAGGGPAPDWRNAPFMDLVGGAGGLLAAPRRRRPAGVAVPAPRRRGPAGRRPGRRWRRWRSTSGGRRSASASPRTPRPTGIVLPDQYYPLHLIARRDWPVPTEFAMAIARQESELDAAGGERGRGARADAADAGDGEAHGRARPGWPTSAARLGDDPIYNARLGHRVPGAAARPLRRLLRAGDGGLQRRAGPGERVDRGVRRPARSRASTRWAGSSRSRSPRPATT